MEGEGGGRGLRMSKRFNNGEVDYKTKSGTAWSHSYLNQKPWHPLSYPNQRRKWIAEQSDAHKQKRAEEVSREYAQEQEFFRQTALISKKEKEKIEMMKAVSFMYVRPPGYNPESAKAAEIADETKQQDHPEPSSSQPAMLPESISGRDTLGEEKKKPRPKDVFGRSIPTAEEFEVLKNAPRLETGVAARAKPFGIEIRNVKCIRCSNYGHQSGDRECPLKDAIMPNEESRLKRDDPLTAIVAQMDPSEPLKWELKQKPGMSPPRGGFDPDNPNQQIVAEDIFDEYGGFLSGNIPELLTTFPLMESTKKSKKQKQKHKRHPSPSREVRAPEEDGLSSSSDYEERRLKKANTKKKPKHSESSSSDDLKFDRHSKKSRHKDSYSSDDIGCSSHNNRSKRRKRKYPHSSGDSGYDKRSKINNSRQKHFHSFEDSDSDERRRSKNQRKKRVCSYEQSSPDKHHKYEKKQKKSYHHSSDDSEYDRCRANKYRSHHHH
ncbi:uncharacterized zinc finger CCHC domain-containing protein At4g19190 [Mercurialis annua]|uniref:uncharacterized zinc finger CCHC domain-containing protein At4g19190 n=1 Tax=Mercurialis annua TaxID=3986 RepID=UPI00215F4606|nr:uncharacterized zinc finger CCHC domain-containing protein At4g19190 [Mercurialis annua]